MSNSSGDGPQIPAEGNLVSVNQPSNPSGNLLSLKLLVESTSHTASKMPIRLNLIKMFSIS